MKNSSLNKNISRILNTEASTKIFWLEQQVRESEREEENHKTTQKYVFIVF